MLDEAQVVSALAARDIVPDATQRDAIAALVALSGSNANGRRHRRQSWNHGNANGHAAVIAACISER